MCSHSVNSQSESPERSWGTSRDGTACQRRCRVLSCGSSRQMSATEFSWSRPVWATTTTARSGFALSAACTPPGRGGIRCTIRSARRAASWRPASRSRSIARRRRRGVTLPPSGKIRIASRGSMVEASREIASRVAPWAVANGLTNRIGRRLSSTSMNGSHCNVSLSTIRGRLPAQESSSWTSRKESPGPACRLSTSSGNSVVAGSPSSPGSAGPDVDTFRWKYLDPNQNRVRRLAARIR